MFTRLAALGMGLSGQRLVDLGTGTGSLARGMAQRGCEVTGVDLSPGMLEAARQLDRVDQLDIEYRVAPAEDTGLASDCAEGVTAGQCWHWFDRPKAAAEVRRLLVPGGRVAIVHFDWLPLDGNLVEQTEALIERHNPAWTMGGGCGLYPQWLRDLGEAGFQGIESFSWDETVLYGADAWRGRIRASAGGGGTLGNDEVAAFDQALKDLLAAQFPGESLAVPQRVFIVLAQSPG